MRSDNRNFKVVDPIGESSKGVFNLDCTGFEPLQLQIGGSAGTIGFSYQAGGPFIHYPADVTLQYDRIHPFVGDIFWETNASWNGSLTVMIGGFVNNLR